MLSGMLVWAGTRAAEPAAAPSAWPTNAPLELVGPGIFKLGKVRLDKPQRTISFPATVNQTAGAIEYLIVTSYGKTHESLLRTDTEPYHIHLALLLLGVKGAGTNSFPADNAQPLPGDKIAIELSWETNGTEQRHRAENFVLNLQTQSKMSRGAWIYNGSAVSQNKFLAQEIGSIASVMEDPDALINNPRPGRENDKIWQVSADGLPPLNAELRVTIKLLEDR